MIKRFLFAVALTLVATAASATLQGRALTTTAAALAWTASESPASLEVRWDARPWEPIATLAAKSTGIYVVELEPGTTYFFRLKLAGGYTNTVALTAHFEPGELCLPGEGVTCYEGGRYRVASSYQGGGRILVVITDTETGRTSTYLDGKRHR